MRLSRAAAIVLRQLYLYRGSPSRVIPLFAWATLDIVLWGFITRYLDVVAPNGPAFVPMLLGAVLLWDFLTRAMQGVTTTFLEDVWSRNFLNVFATPLSIGEYVGGLVLTSVLTSAIGLVVMLVVAWAAFGMSLARYGVLAVPFVLVLFVFGIALGVLGAAIVLRLGPSAEWFVWPIPAIVSPFVGVFYPLATLPAWMQAVGRALPASYVFEGMRSLLAGRPPSALTLGTGAALALLDLVLAWLFFAWVHRLAVRTGLIARYSAESVS
ncbi:ABC-2 type transporter [Gemmatirosa kalamazoonensis]|uniref:Transport permease protein n=1 Tax=Gemmatirosa kalamazoonensis TaxID=861299 RepID=W0RIS2_9BACT|nr:ABC transporter permease [Gemmatirosa kalamazoonensis]AHG89303.1 ABC-2 type transporter [Gemmatirosa kalamazoonensis]